MSVQNKNEHLPLHLAIFSDIEILEYLRKQSVSSFVGKKLEKVEIPEGTGTINLVFDNGTSLCIKIGPYDVTDSFDGPDLVVDGIPLGKNPWHHE